MKRFFALGFLLSSILYFSQEILWKPDVKLQWSDFKNPVNPNKNEAIASTYCGWKVEAEKSQTNPKSPVKISIFVYFDSLKSWKNAEKTSENTLKHEQKHFDICELFARKFRKEIKEKIKNSGDFDRFFKTINEKYSKEYREFQIMYDSETDHGRELDRQKIYDDFITSELETYKDYASN